MRRLTSSLLLGLLAGNALASQTLTGELLQIHYGSRGIWYDTTTRIGVRTDFSGSGTWTEWVGNGSAQHANVFEWSQGSASYTYRGTWVSASWTTLSEEDLSDADWMVARYTWQLGDLEVVKTERWAVDDSVVSVEYEIENLGAEAATDLRMLFWVDGDQDAPTTLSTGLDSRDLDGDGTPDWVQAVGASSGLTIGLGACEQELQEIGSSSTFSTDADVSLLDDDGASYDRPINLRHTVGTLEAGERVRFSFLMSLGPTAADARTGYLDHLTACVVCDLDEDGWVSADCGGTDCDDGDPTIGEDCGGDGGASDGGASDGGASDGGASDGGASDGGASDGGASDGGASDGGASDGGASDGGSSDGGASDGGASDGGASDGGASDGGASDGGSSDGGASDGGASDGGASDGGSSDGGASDGGASDGGSSDGGASDGGASDGGSSDGGSSDGGASDGGSSDGGASDGGSSDGGSSDGGTSDGGSSDGGTSDGGSSDGGSSDGGTSDGGTSDGGSSDGGTSDGGTSDGGSSDGGTSDGGTSDGGSSDGGTSDGGSSDGGTSDGGTSDGGSSEEENGEVKGGCGGCASGGSAPSGLGLGLLALGALRRRRR